MNNKFLLFFCLTSLMLVVSCQETEKPKPTTPIIENPDGTPGNGSGSLALPLVDVIVEAPQGLDLTGASVSTGLMDFPITAEGKSKVVLPDKFGRVAYVFNKGEKLILMGFISKNKTTISLESTAEVLAYFGLAIPFRPKEVQIDFFDGVEGISQIGTFKTVFSQLEFGADGSLENGAFLPSLQELVSSMKQDIEAIDIRSRQINVDKTGIVSGLQVSESDPQNILISNYYRRLAKAFIYKHAYINKDDENRKVNIIKDNFGGTDQADKEIEIPSTTALSGTIGTLVEAAAGNGMKFAKVDTDPISVTLKESEKEAWYKVRIVGPSFQRGQFLSLTEKEEQTYRELMIKQFALDIMLPILGETFGEFKGQFDNDSFEVKLTVEAVTYLISQIPSLWSLIESGDWSAAGYESMKYVVLDVGGGFLQKQLVEKMVDHYSNLPTQEWIDLDRDYTNDLKKARYLKILALIDRALKVADISKLTYEIAASDKIEEFLVKAIEHDVKLSPEETSVLAFKDTEFTVSSQSGLPDGQAFLFKWSTSGTYGYLKDNLGNQGKSFENGQKTIKYFSDATASDLPDDAKDTIYVEAFIKQGQNLTRVGETKSVVTVKPAELVVKPDGITLVGYKKEEVRLYIEWANGDDFHQPEVFDYKYEWSTSGNFGLFYGNLSEANTQDPEIIYKALEEDKEEGVDDITVRVSLSPKGKNSWSYFSQVKGKVKVSNDRNYEIFHLPFSIRTFQHVPGPIYIGFTNYHSVVFPKKENHEEYTVRFYGFKKASYVNTEGKTYSWKAEQAPPRAIDMGYYIPTYQNASIGENMIGLYVAWNSKSCPSHIPCPNDQAASLGQAQGMVEVKIKLKPE